MCGCSVDVGIECSVLLLWRVFVFWYSGIFFFDYFVNDEMLEMVNFMFLFYVKCFV